LSTNLEESARLAGGHRWIENRCFEVLGGWVPGAAGSGAAGAVEASLMLDRHSAHHAWRADQWWDRLPVLARVERDSFCVAPSPGWSAGLDALAALADPGARLCAAYRVVIPRLHSRYSAHLAVAGAVADSSNRRTLGIVMADLAADWQEGERVLESYLGATSWSAAMGAAARIDGLLAG
jgi:hypothetical protein